MSRAAQGARVAISFEKAATRLGGRILIDIEARGEFGVARLPTSTDGRMPWRRRRTSACRPCTIDRKLGENSTEFISRLPNTFYRDILYFGPNSVSTPKDRSATLAAHSARDGDEALRLRDKATLDFDWLRREVFGGTAHE